MTDANKHSSLKGYGDALKQEAELENARYKNDSSLRSTNDDMAELFSGISNAAKSPSGRPRGVGANIAAGLSEGISTGYKMNSTNEKKEKFSKHQNVMNYLQKVNAEVTKQNQHYAEQERRMEIVKPFAIGALEVAYSGMDYNQGNERIRNIIEQAKLADPRIKGDYIGYVPNSPILNLRDQDGNITAFSLSSLTGEDTVKRVQDNYIGRQKVGATIDHVEVDKFDKGIPSKFGQKEGMEATEYGDIPLSKLKGRGTAPLIATVNAEMGIAKEVPVVLGMLDEAEQIIKATPSLGSIWVNFFGPGKVSKTTLDDKVRNAYEKLDKIANRVAETYIRAKGSSISDSERETIKKGLFDVTNLEGSNKYNINSVRKELAIAKERGDYAADRLSEGFISTSASFEKYKKSMQNNNVGSNDEAWSSLGRPSQ